MSGNVVDFFQAYGLSLDVPQDVLTAAQILQTLSFAQQDPDEADKINGNPEILEHSFVDPIVFPTLTERKQFIDGDPPASGIIVDNLDVDFETTATITFVESGAGYKNTVGHYEIAADGTIHSVGIAFANAKNEKKGNEYSFDVSGEDGSEVGFFIIANGFNHNKNINGLAKNAGELKFVYDLGGPNERAAKITDDAQNVSMIHEHVSGKITILKGDIYHTTERGASTAINPDGAVHAISGLAEEGDNSTLRIGFEDLRNLGDADFNDVIFDVNFKSVIGPYNPDDIIYGTDGHDFLYGYDGNDQIFGNNGNDFLYGGTGNDILRGGNGIDVLYGQEGDDQLFGGLGQDFLYGGDGNDILQGEGDADYLAGGNGDDILIDRGNSFFYGEGGYDRADFRLDQYGVIVNLQTGELSNLGGGVGSIDGIEAVWGSDFADDITGTGGNEEFVGRGGNDIIRAGAGNDQIFAGDGDDVILAGSGDDLIDGGRGLDTVSYADLGQGVTIFLTANTVDEGRDGTINDTLISIEHATGSNFSDQINGDGRDNILEGLAGDDTIYGAGGNDVINGGDGRDILYGEDGNDTIYGGEGNDTIAGGSGGDILEGGAGNDTIYGESGNDIIRGGDGEDLLYGDDGDDFLYGGAGSDLVLNGGAGNDFLNGGEGYDRMFGGTGSDIFALDSSNADQFDDILDFNIADGDVLDISDLLEGFYDPDTDNILNYLRINESGGNSLVYTDLDGSASGWTLVARIAGTTGMTDEEQLIIDGTLIV